MARNRKAKSAALATGFGWHNDSWKEVSSVSKWRQVPELGVTHPICPLHCRLDSAIAMVEEAFSKTSVAELVPSPTREKATCQFPCIALGNLIPSQPTAESK